MLEEITTTTGSMPAEGHKPSHSGIFSVHFRPGDFQSDLIAAKVGPVFSCTGQPFTYAYFEQSFKRGDAICPFDRYGPGKRIRTSLQLGEEEHCELNTDLVFGMLTSTNIFRSKESDCDTR